MATNKPTIDTDQMHYVHIHWGFGCVTTGSGCHQQTSKCVTTANSTASIVVLIHRS